MEVVRRIVALTAYLLERLNSSPKLGPDPRSCKLERRIIDCLHRGNRRSGYNMRNYCMKSEFSEGDCASLEPAISHSDVVGKQMR